MKRLATALAVAAVLSVEACKTNDTGTSQPADTPTPASASASPSASPQPKVATVPNLVGQNAAVAKDQLSKLGFKDVELGSKDADNRIVILPENWTVTTQSTAAGSQVLTDVLIVLGCTKHA